MISKDPQQGFVRSREAEEKRLQIHGRASQMMTKVVGLECSNSQNPLGHLRMCDGGVELEQAISGAVSLKLSHLLGTDGSGQHQGERRQPQLQEGDPWPPKPGLGKFRVLPVPSLSTSQGRGVTTLWP